MGSRARGGGSSSSSSLSVCGEFCGRVRERVMGGLDMGKSRAKGQLGVDG